MQAIAHLNLRLRVRLWPVDAHEFDKTGKNKWRPQMEAVKRILAKMVGEEISAEEIQMVSGGENEHINDSMCAGATITGYAEYDEPICDS
jgi:hypothetical protein